ncbi:MAG: signal recognition particle receptor subunit alpha, partial [Gammaproteobacteria bacterium]
MIFKGKREQAAPPSTGLFGGLRAGLRRTRENLLGGLARLIAGKASLDPKTLEEIEDLLLGADLGIEATTKVVADLKQRLQRHSEGSDAKTLLREELVALLRPVEQPLGITATGERPFVMLVVGVNGSGKTTTIGKLAHLFKRRNLSVALAAGDTFRAAAVEQLKA